MTERVVSSEELLANQSLTRLFGAYQTGRVVDHAFLFDVAALSHNIQDGTREEWIKRREKLIENADDNKGMDADVLRTRLDALREAYGFQKNRTVLDRITTAYLATRLGSHRLTSDKAQQTMNNAFAAYPAAKETVDFSTFMDDLAGSRLAFERPDEEWPQARQSLLDMDRFINRFHEVDEARRTTQLNALRDAYTLNQDVLNHLTEAYIAASR